MSWVNHNEKWKRPQAVLFYRIRAWNAFMKAWMSKGRMCDDGEADDTTQSWWPSSKDDISNDDQPSWMTLRDDAPRSGHRLKIVIKRSLSSHKMCKASGCKRGCSILRPKAIYFNLHPKGNYSLMQSKIAKAKVPWKVLRLATFWKTFHRTFWKTFQRISGLLTF